MTPLVPVLFNAVVLSGGRSSRLGGTPKARLELNGRSLLDLTCQAVAAAQRIVVVGPETDRGVKRSGSLAGPGSAPASPNLEFVRESPPFGGPAAALAAAVEHLSDDTTGWLLVLACDMPGIAQAVPILTSAVAEHPEESVMARDGGRDQPLAALYRLDSLHAAVAAVNGNGGPRNLSMKALLARVQWRPIDVPQGSTADVDTWADAQSLGVTGTAPT